MAPGPLPCAVNDVCPVLVWSHTVVGLFQQEHVSDSTQLESYNHITHKHQVEEEKLCFCLDNTCFSSRCRSTSTPLCFKMIYSCCWMMKWVVTSLCPPQDGFNLLSPPEVLLTSAVLLPVTPGLVTLDGQRGVNPLLLRTPDTAKSGVTQNPFWKRKPTGYVLVLKECVNRELQRFVWMFWLI